MQKSPGPAASPRGIAVAAAWVRSNGPHATPFCPWQEDLLLCGASPSGAAGSMVNRKLRACASRPGTCQSRILLFVAVSIRIASIARSQELRNRAAQTLSLFGTVLIISVLIAIPRQAYRTLGAELVVLAVIAGIGLHILDRRAKGEKSSQAIGPVLEAVTPITVTSLLLLAAGTVLVLGVHAGLYVLVGPVIVALAGGVTSAWLLLTKITE